MRVKPFACKPVELVEELRDRYRKCKDKAELESGKDPFKRRVHRHVKFRAYELFPDQQHSFFRERICNQHCQKKPDKDYSKPVPELIEVSHKGFFYIPGNPGRISVSISLIFVSGIRGWFPVL